MHTQQLNIARCSTALAHGVCWHAPNCSHPELPFRIKKSLCLVTLAESCGMTLRHLHTPSTTVPSTSLAFPRAAISSASFVDTTATRYCSCAPPCSMKPSRTPEGHINVHVVSPDDVLRSLGNGNRQRLVLNLLKRTKLLTLAGINARETFTTLLYVQLPFLLLSPLLSTSAFRVILTVSSCSCPLSHLSWWCDATIFQYSHSSVSIL